jgi:nitroreductase
MIEDIIKKRRSISSFTDKRVPLELIDNLISISSYAPSSCNTQPWFFLVFYTKQSKEKLNDYIKKGYERTNRDFILNHGLVGNIYVRLLNFFYNYGKFNQAPILILLFARPYNTPLFAQAIKLSKNKQIEKIANDSVKTSCAMAMQNFLLIAHEEGLGARVKDGIKFVINFEDLRDEFYKEFKIPLNYEFISGIQLGYPTKLALERVASKRLSLDKIRKFI